MLVSGLVKCIGVGQLVRIEDQKEAGAFSRAFVITSLSSFTTSSTQRSDGLRMRSTSCLMSDSNAASDVKRPVRMPRALMMVSRICARSSSSLPFSLRALSRAFTALSSSSRLSRSSGGSRPRRTASSCARRSSSCLRSSFTSSICTWTWSWLSLSSPSVLSYSLTQSMSVKFLRAHLCDQIGEAFVEKSVDSRAVRQVADIDFGVLQSDAAQVLLHVLSKVLQQSEMESALTSMLIVCRLSACVHYIPALLRKAVRHDITLLYE